MNSCEKKLTITLVDSKATPRRKLKSRILRILKTKVFPVLSVLSLVMLMGTVGAMDHGNLSDAVGFSLMFVYEGLFALFLILSKKSEE